MELYDASDLYEGFEYPAGIRKVVELGLVDLDLWWILEAAFAGDYARDMAKRYPDRRLVPFAKRSDCDDVACFDIDRPGKVEIVHDFADSGWEQRGEYDDFWSWFEAAVADMVAYEREEEAAGGR
ncbi:MAG: hypothetical protein K5859_00915 [Atopobiaceae bacterium]|nr:hypothetical protein [Atopobiaceae bacterium]